MILIPSYQTWVDLSITIPHFRFGLGEGAGKVVAENCGGLFFLVKLSCSKDTEKKKKKKTTTLTRFSFIDLVGGKKTSISKR